MLRSIGSPARILPRARKCWRGTAWFARACPLATQVGLDILKRGGSAVDAAIAANATLGLMEPVSNGVGGDLFAIVYSAKENKLYGINGSGRSPLGLSYEQMKAELAKLKRETIPPTGMLPISVPGCGRRLVRAAQKIRQTETR